MGEEQEEQLEIEKFRAVNYALGSNPATSGEYLKRMIEENVEEEVYETDKSWLTPEGVEDIERMFSQAEQS